MLIISEQRFQPIFSGIFLICILSVFFCSSSNDKNDDKGSCKTVRAIEVPAVYNPTIATVNFTNSTTIDNPYMPFKPGTVYSYEGSEDENVIQNDVGVTNTTKILMGITCVEVKDTVNVNSELEEQTLDWYAQDNDGNVWYFGEDSKEYADGSVISTSGSWEAGTDGALPGIVMPASPSVGNAYRQEYYAGEAEDLFEIMSSGETVDVTYGTFTDTVVTREMTPLEPCVAEKKYYAKDVGFIKSVMIAGGNEEISLSLKNP